MLTFLLAEAKLKSDARTNPNFLRNLLTLIAEPQIPLPVRQAAALFFKNFVRENWKVVPLSFVKLMCLG
jgi:hypothetical protein